MDQVGTERSVVTQKEIDDLLDLVVTRKAFLYRKLAACNLSQLQAELSCSYETAWRLENGKVLNRAREGIYDRYYAILCRWREQFGDVSFARPE